MSSRTVDRLQAKLRDDVFHYAKDGKKAAGRALGTLVEIISYYKLAAWGFGPSLLIERKVPEFGRPDIHHNVEFSLHKRLGGARFKVERDAKPWTKARLAKHLTLGEARLANNLLQADGLMRNAAVLDDNDGHCLVLNIVGVVGQTLEVEETIVHPRPVAIVECKRVGVEEGMRKGPQSIEKAKQGAYVAKSVSSLQKVIDADGHRSGFLPRPGRTPIVRPYDELLADIIAGRVPLPHHFVLTVGVTSNHGNWFTAATQNKEMKVLAAAYDWLLFLTDDGLLSFAEDCILDPIRGCEAISAAFSASYTGVKGGNRFTKTRLDIEADRQLRAYFAVHAKKTDGWFNVISPARQKLRELPVQLRQLLAL